MRHALCLAALLCASDVQAALLPLVSPGPPVSTEGYMEVVFDLAGASGVSARVVNHLDSHAVIDSTIWMPRVTATYSSQYLGAVQLLWPNNDVVLVRLQPEIDAGLAGVDVSFGTRSGNFRPVTITGAGGYSRTYDANAIPEPGSLALLLAGCLPFVRRRA